MDIATKTSQILSEARRRRDITNPTQSVDLNRIDPESCGLSRCTWVRALVEFIGFPTIPAISTSILVSQFPSLRARFVLIEVFSEHGSRRAHLFYLLPSKSYGD